MRRLLKSKKGQGTTEYIVILGVVVAIAIAIVYKNLSSSLQSGVNTIGQSVANATAQQTL